MVARPEVLALQPGSRAQHASQVRSSSLLIAQMQATAAYPWQRTARIVRCMRLHCVRHTS
jgi:hypothetical protein